jgi:type I restriction enzyme S subunit
MIQDSTLWIGKVPEHWDLLKGKELFVQVKRGVREDDGTVTAFRDGVVTLRSNRRTTGFTEAVQFSGYQGVEPGDLVIHQMDGFAGAIGVSDSRGRCSPVCAVSVPRGTANTYYYARVLRAMAVSGWIAALAKGIRERSTDFRFAVFREQVLPVPPEEEQALIVRYLDHAEMRIAKAIAGKTDLLTKLLEMSRAKIAADILGAGAGVRVHDGLPFEVPSSWSIEPFWAVAPEVSVSGHAEKELLSVYLDRGVIRYSESGGQVHKPSLDRSAYQLVRPHNLVLNNQQAWRGSVGVSRHEGIISPAYVVCRLDDRFDTDFANLLFRSPVMVSQFELASRGVGSIQRQLHRPSLRVLRVPIPPRSEQGRIASQLIAETRGIDVAAESLREEIALLKEYRTRLLSDVVTGKIDVREEAAKLPDIDPAELAAVLAGGAAGADEEEVADGDD